MLVFKDKKQKNPLILLVHIDGLVILCYYINIVKMRVFAHLSCVKRNYGDFRENKRRC